MTTYVHATTHDAKGRYRPTSWHLLREWIGSEWRAFCGRRFPDSADTMSETPEAATCETCFRYEAKARERRERSDLAGKAIARVLSEDDPAVGQVDPETTDSP